MEYKRSKVLGKKEVRRRHRASWDKLFTDLEHKTCRTQREAYRILKHISKDIKETAKIHRNIDETVFLRYYEKLWNATNVNVPKLGWNLSNHIDAVIKLADFEKALKVTKNDRSPAEDNINWELEMYASEEFKLGLLQFLNNIYTKSCLPN